MENLYYSLERDNMNENIPAFVIIESDLLLDDNLTNTDKILYGIICALSTNKESACFAHSDYICKLAQLKPRQLRYCLQKLRKYNYVSIEFKNNRRFIKPVINKFLQNRNRVNQEASKYADSKEDILDYNWLDEDWENLY